MRTKQKFLDVAAARNTEGLRDMYFVTGRDIVERGSAWFDIAPTYGLYGHLGASMKLKSVGDCLYVYGYTGNLIRFDGASHLDCGFKAFDLAEMNGVLYALHYTSLYTSYIYRSLDNGLTWLSSGVLIDTDFSRSRLYCFENTLFLSGVYLGTAKFSTDGLTWIDANTRTAHASPNDVTVSPGAAVLYGGYVYLIGTNQYLWDDLPATLMRSAVGDLTHWEMLHSRETNPIGLMTKYSSFYGFIDAGDDLYIIFRDSAHAINLDTYFELRKVNPLTGLFNEVVMRSTTMVENPGSTGLRRIDRGVWYGSRLYFLTDQYDAGCFNLQSTGDFVNFQNEMVGNTPPIYVTGSTYNAFNYSDCFAVLNKKLYVMSANGTALYQKMLMLTADSLTGKFFIETLTERLEQ